MTDEDLKLLYILKNAARVALPSYRNKPAWCFVMDIMSLGATSAYKICGNLGINPEMKAKEI